MRDHGLFQAICRTNRLDGDDKPFGYIVDYTDLFKKLVNDKGTGALQVYSAELDDSASGVSPDVLMQDRLKKGRERLDQALGTVELLCAPVDPPAVRPRSATRAYPLFLRQRGNPGGTQSPRAPALRTATRLCQHR